MDSQIELIKDQDYDKISLLDRKVSITTPNPVVEILSLADIDNRILNENQAIEGYNKSIEDSNNKISDLEALRTEVEQIVK